MERTERRSHEPGEGMSFKQAYRPFFLEYALLAELNLVRRQQPNGVFVIPSNASALLWFGIIFVRQGHYEGGAFKFTIYIPATFPDCDCPTVIFENPPFHPMISSSTGEFDTSKSFAKWKRGTNHLWQLLLCLRRSFYQLDLNEPFNIEAAKLFERDPNLFKHKASESVKLSETRLTDPSSSIDPHALVFRRISEVEFEEIREQMSSSSSSSSSAATRRDSRADASSSSSSSSSKPQGLSWVLPGSRTVFSKDPSFSAKDQDKNDERDDDDEDEVK